MTSFEGPISVGFNLIMSSPVIVSKFKKIRVNSLTKGRVSGVMINERLTASRGDSVAMRLKKTIQMSFNPRILM